MVDYLRYVKPNRKFTRNLLVTERYHRIDVCCSPGGEVACRRYHQHEHDCGGCKGYRIECRHSKQQLSNEASQQEGAAKPECYSDGPNLQTLRQHQTEDLGRTSADRHTDSKLLGPSGYHERHHSVDADGCQR